MYTGFLVRVLVSSTVWPLALPLGVKWRIKYCIEDSSGTDSTGSR